MPCDQRSSGIGCWLCMDFNRGTLNASASDKCRRLANYLCDSVLGGIESEGSEHFERLSCYFQFR